MPSRKRLRRVSTIADFARERLRRSGDRVREADAGLAADTAGLRLPGAAYRHHQHGRRLLAADDLEQEALAEREDSVKPDRTDEDLLFQVLLDWGLDLSDRSRSRRFDGHRVLRRSPRMR